MPSIPKTRTELKNILAGELEGLVRDHIATAAIGRSCEHLDFSEIAADYRLWERLGTAYEALRALRNYIGEPQGFVLLSSEQAKLR